MRFMLNALMVLARMLRQTDRQTDRQTEIPQGKRLSQGLNVARSEEKKPILTEISAPLCARDYKGVRNREYSTVVGVVKEK